ncbi:MAG TPA: TolC family protein, partial [Paludibacter sp.]|nr:TolC family protein [Paludibacter sp.]
MKRCIETGLERNLEIKITQNNQQISDNNLTIGNAGFLPTVDINSGYSGSINNVKQFPADGSANINSNGINNSGLDAGVFLNWTVFDGFNVNTNYARLKELQQKGELNSRLTIENFVADLTGEYCNFVQ